MHTGVTEVVAGFEAATLTDRMWAAEVLSEVSAYAETSFLDSWRALTAMQAAEVYKLVSRDTGFDHHGLVRHLTAIHAVTWAGEIRGRHFRSIGRKLSPYSPRARGMVKKLLILQQLDSEYLVGWAYRGTLCQDCHRV